MTSIPPLQCLFCNHLNPADASFCNHCGSQMHLQPCDRCGVIDKRSAKNCYKCGSAFTLPASPDPHTAPALADQPQAVPTLFEVAIERELMSVHPDPALWHLAPQTEHETGSTQSAETATRWPRPWGLGASALLLAAVAVSGYYYFGPSAPSATQPGAVKLAPELSGAPIAADTPTVNVAPPLGGASASRGPTPSLASDTPAPEAASAPVAPGAGATMTARPSTATGAEVKTRQDSAILKECPEAVATLGLCNPSTKQEKQ